MTDEPCLDEATRIDTRPASVPDHSQRNRAGVLDVVSQQYSWNNRRVGASMPRYASSNIVSGARAASPTIEPSAERCGRRPQARHERSLPWEYLLVLLLGHSDSFNVLADRTANWSQLLARGIDIPRSDALPDPEPILAEIAGSLRREPLPKTCSLPSSTASQPGASAEPKHPGDDVTTFADNLRGLADALTAFNTYRPGEFLDERVVAEVAERRRLRGQRGMPSTVLFPATTSRAAVSVRWLRAGCAAGSGETRAAPGAPRRAPRHHHR